MLVGLGWGASWMAAIETPREGIFGLRAGREDLTTLPATVSGGWRTGARGG